MAEVTSLPRASQATRNNARNPDRSAKDHYIYLIRKDLGVVWYHGASTFGQNSIFI